MAKFFARNWPRGLGYLSMHAVVRVLPRLPSTLGHTPDNQKDLAKLAMLAKLAGKSGTHSGRLPEAQ
jgi:hypothetical protein